MENITPFVFNWKLNPEDYNKSIFDKKRMLENTDIKKIYGFIKNQEGISYEGIPRYKGIQYKNEFDQMIKYKETYNPTQKKFIVSFHLPKHKWGRVIPAHYSSLSVCHRPTRHALCQGIYIDIDIVNAQPTILLEICKQNNIELPALNLYVQDPKNIRQIIMEHHNVNKDIAKQLPISLMFGGSYKSWAIENNVENYENKIKEIVDFEMQLKPLIEIIYTHNKNTIEKAVLKHDPNKWKTIDEKKRGVVALWCQSVERLLQETSIEYLVNEKNFKIEEIVPCQDGFMILKELWYDELLDDIQNIIKTKLQFNIQFIVKAFDEAIEIPIYDGEKSVEEWNDLLSAKRLADRYINEWDKFIIIEDGQLFIYKDNRWWNETEEKKRYKLIRYISEDLYSLLEKELHGAIELDKKDLDQLMKTLRDMTSKGGPFNDIVRQLLSMVKQSKNTFNKKDFLLGFDNGVVDLKTKEFRQYEYNDYMTISTNYNYKEVDYGCEDWNDEKKEWTIDYLQKDENQNYKYDITPEQIELWTENRKLLEELNEIINTIQPDKEQCNLYLQILASGVDGRAYQHLFLFNGQGGNGKGFTGSMMGKILGEYYYQAPNGIIKDIEKSNTASPDLYNCMHKRYINFKEVCGSIKTATLRNLTGGGEFSARLLNCNPVQFKLSSTIVMEFNNAPDFDVKLCEADIRRQIYVDFITNFTNDKNKIDKNIGGTSYKKANTYYETDDFMIKMRPIFLDLLLNVYKMNYKEDKGILFEIPDSVSIKTKKFIEDQNLFQKVFNDIYKEVEIKILGNGKIDKEDEKAKTIQIKHMWESFKESEDYKKLRTIREKREYGREEYYKWCDKKFKVEGDPKKTGKFIKGVMIKNEDNEEEID